MIRWLNLRVNIRTMIKEVSIIKETFKERIKKVRTSYELNSVALIKS